MKKINFKTKIIAAALAVVTACSVSMMAVTSASAATFDTGFEVTDVVFNAEYQVGMGLIREFVPGGQAIAGLIDSLVGSFTDTDSGPSLSDLSKDISDFRADVSRQFDKVEKELKNIQEELVSSTAAIQKDIAQQSQLIAQQARLIEQQVVSQTTIAAKGATFDSLMTALQETARQIAVISADDTLSEQDKSLQIALLIGRNDKWNSSSNLYFGYMSFLNALTSSTFCATGNHDIFYYIYQSNLPYAAFSWDAKTFSKPYVECLMQLGTYAYSIMAECLSAARQVAGFTADDLAELTPNDAVLYHEVASLKSIVDDTFANLNKKVFDISDPNSVAAHLQGFNEINGRVFVRNGTVNIPLKSSIVMDSKYHQYGDPQDPYKTSGAINPIGGAQILNNYQNSSPLSFDDIKYLVSYVKSFYPGKTMADYLMMVGFDDDNLRDVHWRKHQLYLMTGSAKGVRVGNAIQLFYDGIDLHDNQVEIKNVASSRNMVQTEYGSSLGTDTVMFFIADN